MASVDTSLEVKAPVERAYAQWTQFESFPLFMTGIEQVEQISDTQIRFHGKVAGKDHTWTAKIVEQVPNSRIAWRTIEGPDNGGTVLFEAIDPQRTRIKLMMDYEPQDWVERVGDALGFFKGRVEADLRNYKEYVETGAVPEGWKGEVHGGVRTR